MMDVLRKLICENNAMKICLFKQSIEVAQLRFLAKEQNAQIERDQEAIELMKKAIADASILIELLQGVKEELYG